jgi:hypothetical protein
VNLSDYLDTGLFLDHRRTRALVRAEAGQTGAEPFLLHRVLLRLRGGRGRLGSGSVDLSNTYLDWAAENFALNGFETVRAASSGYRRTKRLPGRFRLVRAMPSASWPGCRSGPFLDTIVLDPSDVLQLQEEWKEPRRQADYRSLVESLPAYPVPRGTSGSHERPGLLALAGRISQGLGQGHRPMTLGRGLPGPSAAGVLYFQEMTARIAALSILCRRGPRLLRRYAASRSPPLPSVARPPVPGEELRDAAFRKIAARQPGVPRFDSQAVAAGNSSFLLAQGERGYAARFVPAVDQGTYAACCTGGSVYRRFASGSETSPRVDLGAARACGSPGGTKRVPSSRSGAVWNFKDGSAQPCTLYVALETRPAAAVGKGTVGPFRFPEKNEVDTLKSRCYHMSTCRHTGSSRLDAQGAPSGTLHSGRDKGRTWLRKSM